MPFCIDKDTITHNIMSLQVTIPSYFAMSKAFTPDSL